MKHDIPKIWYPSRRSQRIQVYVIYLLCTYVYTYIHVFVWTRIYANISRPGYIHVTWRRIDTYTCTSFFSPPSSYPSWEVLQGLSAFFVDEFIDCGGNFSVFYLRKSAVARSIFCFRIAVHFCVVLVKRKNRGGLVGLVYSQEEGKEKKEEKKKQWDDSRGQQMDAVGLRGRICAVHKGVRRRTGRHEDARERM